MTRSYNVAYLVSHPIQYQAPMLRHIAASARIDLTVYFLSDFSTRGYKDQGFGTAVEWDVPLLGGYKHVVLPALGPSDRLTSLRPFVHGLWGHLRAGKYDALWLHGYAHQASLRALMIAKFLGIKVLVRAESQIGSAARTRANTAVKEALLRRLFAKVDAFLAIGSLNKSYYCHYGVPSEKIFSMPYAVGNDFFRSKSASAHPKRETLRQELGLAAGRPIILYASKFVSRKRAGDVLEAYAQLSSDGRSEPHPYLLFIGDGEDRGKVEARAKQLGWSSVHFLGFKNQTDLPALYDLCDVFVLASEREPWGLIVNEVMNAGKAVIVSDQVGCGPDLVRDGRNGYIVPTGDVSALANRLRKITADRDCAEKMGEQSRDIIGQWGFDQDLAGLLMALEATCGSEKVSK